MTHSPAVTATLCFAAAWLSGVPAEATAPPGAASTAGIPTPDSSTSLLVVAPHPDDETLCCAGVIQRVLHAGGRVSVVWITSGDASELDLLVVERSLRPDPGKLRDLGRRRMQESREAAATLGIAPGQLFFLGFPDRGVLAILTDYYVTAFRSKYTHASSVPYAGTLVPGQPYTGERLERDFESILDTVHPTLILAPSPLDSHPDHRASGLLAIRAMSRRNELPQLRYWIVHGGELWPLPRGYAPERDLSPPPRGAGLAFQSFALHPAEVDRKHLALGAYRTQMQVMSSYLLAFVRRTELYSALPVPEP